MVKLDLESTLYLEIMNHRHPEGGFVETQKLVLYWKSWPITIKQNRELAQAILLKLKKPTDILLCLWVATRICWICWNTHWIVQWKIRVTDHGDSSLLSYFNGDTELWRRRAGCTVANQHTAELVYVYGHSKPCWTRAATWLCRSNWRLHRGGLYNWDYVGYREISQAPSNWIWWQCSGCRCTVGESSRSLQCMHRRKNGFEGRSNDGQAVGIGENEHDQNKEWTFFIVWWIIKQLLKANDICAFLPGNQGVVCFSNSKHAWFDRGPSKRIDHQATTGNWIRFGQLDSTNGSYESQENEDHMLLL